MNNELGSNILAAALPLAAIVTLVWGVMTLRYRITDTAVEVVIFGWCARRVRLDDIDHIQRGGCFWNEHWTTFKFWNAVTLRRKTGLFKNFVITPGHPDQFIVELSHKLENIEP